MKKLNYKKNYIILLAIFILFIVLFRVYFNKEGLSYTKYFYKDYSKGDLIAYQNISLSECNNKCTNNTECKGIVADYFSGTGNCWLKKSINTSKLSNNNKTTTYVKIP